MRVRGKKERGSRRSVQRVLLLCLTLTSLVSLATSADPLPFTHTLSKVLSLSWQWNTDSIVMEIVKNDKGWAGIGLAKDMSKGEIILVESDGVKATVKSCYLVGYSDPICDMVQSWYVLSSSADQKGFRVRIERSLDKVDTTYGTSIKQGENPIIYAYTGSPSIQPHFGGDDCGFGSANIDFSKGSSGGKTSVGVKFGFIRHEYAEAIIWTIVTDILILFGRHFRFFPSWMEIHWIVFMLVYIMSLLANNTGQKRTPTADPSAYAQEHKNASNHKFFAKFLIYFCVAQLLVGLLLRASKIWRKKFENWANWLSYSHIFLGIGIWGLTRYLVVVGAILFKAKFTDPHILNYVIVETVLFCLLLIGLEIYKRVKSSSQGYLPITNKVRDVDITEVDSLVAPLPGNPYVRAARSSMSAQELIHKYPNKIIVLFNNNIYDMTDFSHPGGKSLLLAARWKDVGRYVLGICGLEEDGAEGYTHSAEALGNLPSRLIGSLLGDDSELYDQWPLKSSTGGVVFANGEFKLTQKIKFSESTSLFKWHHPGVRLVTNLKGFDWMGKHYMVSAPGMAKKIRLYTHCMSLADEVRAHDRGLVQRFHALITSDPKSSSNEIPALPSSLDYIPSSCEAVSIRFKLFNYYSRVANWW
jgi:hypothetical protein